MHLVAIGGSDAGISAALRARELDPTTEVTVVVADAYPNFSICGIPYYVSGEVTHWRNLAHRTLDDLKATGMQVRLNTVATKIDVGGRRLHVVDEAGVEDQVAYDELVVGTGAASVRPPIEGLQGPEALGPSDGVHLLHSMGDTFELVRTLEERPAGQRRDRWRRLHRPRDGRGAPRSRLVGHPVRAASRGAPHRRPGAWARWSMRSCRHTASTCGPTRRSSGSPGHPKGSAGRFQIDAVESSGAGLTAFADMVLVVVGVRPDTELAASAGAELGIGGAISVDRGMRTNLERVFAAGDCVVTHHRLLGLTYLPLGTTAHKQGRVAGENAIGGNREFAGSLGTQVVKVFDMAACRTGLRDHEAVAAGFDPLTVEFEADDHKAYYPGSHRIRMRYTGDRTTGRLLGVQLFGHRHAEVAKRIDIAAAAIFNEMTVDAMSDLDLSYTPPLGSPWDAVQMGAQAWVRAHGSSND